MTPRRQPGGPARNRPLRRVPARAEQTQPHNPYALQIVAAPDFRHKNFMGESVTDKFEAFNHIIRLSGFLLVFLTLLWAH